MSNTYSQRAATMAPPSAGQRRSISWNPAERTFDAVVTSETPVPIFDVQTGDVVDEVLLVEGGEFPDRVPLLDSHNRDSTSDVVGNVSNFRRDGTEWIGTGRIAPPGSSAKGDEAAMQIEEGFIDGVSLGYRVFEAEYIRPNDSKVINGRRYSAGNRPMKIATRWEALEVSLVAIPADATARIRTANFSAQTRSSNVPAIHSRNSITGRAPFEAYQAAAMMKTDAAFGDPSQRWYQQDENMQFRRVDPHPALERIVDRGQDFTYMPLWQLMQYAAETRGQQFPSKMSPWFVFERAVTTIGPEFVGPIVGSLVMAGFDEVIDTTQGWVSEVDVPRPQQERQRVGMAGTLKRRPDGMEAAHVEFEATTEEIDLAPFANQVFVDEQAVVGMDSFVPESELSFRQLGHAAARLRPDLVYALLLDNPTMRDGTALFHADHSNLSTSTSLTAGTVQTVLETMSGQSEGNVPLYLQGTHLIVPEAMRQTAQEIARQQNVGDGESTPNVIAKVEPRIGAGVTDPVSETAHAGESGSWFVAARSSVYGVEVQYLEGRGRVPEIRSWMGTHGRYGVGFDISHWVGVKALSWEGLAKATA